MQNNKKKSNSFLVQGGILAIASILVRVIGIIYRVPLTAIIGDKGNTFYSTAYSIYSVLLLVSSYSLPVAVSRLISVKAAAGEYRNIQRIVTVTMGFAIVVGGGLSLLTLFGAEFLASAISKAPLAAIPLRFLAPSILVVALLGTYRGFFQGMGSTVPTAVSQVLEQISHAIVCLIAAHFLFQYGQKVDTLKGTDSYAYAWGAAGGTIGCTVGAIVALLFCLLVYTSYSPYFRKMIRRDQTGKLDSYGSIGRTLLFTIVPVVLSTAVYNLIDITDQVIYSHNVAETVYESTWGVYTAKYLLLIHVPVAIASAMAASTVPAISRSQKQKDNKEVVRKAGTVIKCTMLIAIPSAVGLSVLANPIIKLLFHGDTSSANLYLMVGGCAVIFFSLATITNGILQGIGKMKIPVRNSAISLALHMILLVVLMRYTDMGIFAVIFSYIFFGVCICTLNSFAINRYLEYHQNLTAIYILPGAAAAVMGICAYFIHIYMTKWTGSNTIGVIAAIVAAILIYGILVVRFRIVREEEILSMPKGTGLVKLCRKLHLLPRSQEKKEC